MGSSTRRGERGWALILALVVATLLMLLGLTLAQIAADENQIARNHLLGNQSLYAAEGAARCVRGWFEEPDPSSGFLVPLPAEVDRSLRRVDPDGDGVHSSYATAAFPWNVIYRQGTNDLFERPYKGSPDLSFEGDSAGPDVRIARSGSTGERAFLERMTAALFPAFPSERERAFVVRIDLYAPPSQVISGRRTRLGFVTIEVTAALLKNYGLPSEREVGLRTVRAVLSEPPYRNIRGPLLAGQDADLRAGIEARWGLVAARGDIVQAAASSIASPSGWPRRAAMRPLLLDENVDGTLEDTDADGTADWDEWWLMPDDTIEDPWFFASAGGSITGAPSPGGLDDVPYPFDPSDVPIGPGGPYDPDTDLSNSLQRATFDPVPGLDYELWKLAARSGFAGHHYFASVPGAALWREDGSGPPMTVGEATRGRRGLFFFDTADGKAPADLDADGTMDNLAPPVVLGAGWWSGGVLFISASEVSFVGIGWNGNPRTISPPGEPCVDRDRDGHCGADEPFLQLDYPGDPLAPGAAFRRLALKTARDGTVRRITGPARETPLAFEGVLIVAGNLRGGGDACVFGSAIVGRSALPEPTGSPSSGILRLLADPNMPLGLAPTRGAGAPRTIVTSWEVEREAAILDAP